MAEVGLSVKWEDFCRRGRYSLENQRKSVMRSLCEDGVVRGYYSKLCLDPTRDVKDALYPSHDHLAGRDDDTEMVVDARVINDMKTILSEAEFWRLVEHLYAVGRDERRIAARKPERLDESWSPAREY